MNEQTEEKVQDILLSLVEFDGNMEKGFGTTVNVSKAQEDIISLIQKEREDAIKGYVRWAWNNGLGGLVDDDSVEEYLSQTKGGKQ